MGLKSARAWCSRRRCLPPRARSPLRAASISTVKNWCLRLICDSFRRCIGLCSPCPAASARRAALPTCDRLRWRRLRHPQPRPSAAATRSPETTIPAMIAAPKTMYCIAADSPMITSIWVSNVSAIAAIHVDVALARPPPSDAPAITTAAIGASRYAEPKAGSMLPLTPARSTRCDRIQDACRRVGEHEIRPDVQARHPRRSRVGAHRLEPPADGRVADEQRDDDRDREHPSRRRR